MLYGEQGSFVEACAAAVIQIFALGLSHVVTDIILD